VRLRIATRRSALALVQTRQIAAALVALDPSLDVVEVQIVTEGDRRQQGSLAEIGGKGLFIKELEAALVEGRADLAVHSMKDLPVDLADGLAIAAVPPRASAFDLLITRDGAALDALPSGARVGTSSLRRKYQLLHARPDLDVQLLRGNVDTRLRRLTDGDFVAIVLAEAGVRRLGLDVRAIGLGAQLVPAVAQGALALETRADDRAIRDCAARLDDASTASCVGIERDALRALGADCTMPVGAYAVGTESGFSLRGFLADNDGTRMAWAEFGATTDERATAGRQIAEELRRSIERSERR